MPELPEVETIRRHLQHHLCGRRILGVRVLRKDFRRQLDVEALHSLCGRRIVSLSRRGKFLLWHFDDGRTVAFHLGMSGRLGLCPPETPLKRHDHVIFTLESGQVRFNDVRRFGMIEVLACGALRSLWALGPEPFARRCTAAYLWQKGKGCRRAVKDFLMDGRILAGVGNIYANETLFAAGVHPLRPAASLSLDEWQRVRGALRAVLSEAIKAGGTTLQDGGYQNAQGEPGFFQLRLRVYGRAGEACRTCAAPIERVVHSGRSTYFCPRCQK